MRKRRKFRRARHEVHRQGLVRRLEDRKLQRDVRRRNQAGYEGVSGGDLQRGLAPDRGLQVAALPDRRRRLQVSALFAAREMSNGEHKCVCLVEYKGDGVDCTRIEDGPAPVANNSSGQFVIYHF